MSGMSSRRGAPSAADADGRTEERALAPRRHAATVPVRRRHVGELARLEAAAPQSRGRARGGLHVIDARGELHQERERVVRVDNLVQRQPGAARRDRPSRRIRSDGDVIETSPVRVGQPGQLAQPEELRGGGPVAPFMSMSDGDPRKACRRSRSPLLKKRSSSLVSSSWSPLPSAGVTRSARRTMRPSSVAFKYWNAFPIAPAAFRGEDLEMNLGTLLGTAADGPTAPTGLAPPRAHRGTPPARLRTPRAAGSRTPAATARSRPRRRHSGRSRCASSE